MITIDNPTVTLVFQKKKKDFLEKTVAFNNLSLSDFVRQKALASAEGQIDLQTYQQLMKEHGKNDQSISHEEILKERHL